MTVAIKYRDILYGSVLDSCIFQRSKEAERFFFQDKNKKKIFAIDDPTVFKNILLLGGAGSGKTNVLNQFADQVIKWNKVDGDGVSLIFDTKGDYQRRFYRPGDYLLGNDIRFRGRSVIWNLFEEVLADGEDPVDYESNAREIASVLFKDRGSKTQPFFANAARDIFAYVVIYFIRRQHEKPERWGKLLNNYCLVRFLLTKSPQQLVGYFRHYPDMNGLISYLGKGDNNQALGVLAELRSMVYDCFQGVFARRPESGAGFSIRKAIRSKGGKNIFILYDLSVGEIMTPIYRLLVDLALKEALSEKANGHTHIFLDELKLLPKISHLEDALNFGRSKRVSIMAGLQSVGQIYSIYGQEAGQVILGGFGSVIAMKTADYESREYISKLFGPNLLYYRYYSESSEPIDRERDGNTVEHWDIQALKPGDAIIGLASQKEPFPFTFQFIPSSDLS